jgi:signal peptidase II
VDLLQRVGLLVAALVALLDQASKWLMLVVVMQPPRSIEVTSFFNLVLVYNSGISFGMFTDDSGVSRWLLIGIALAIIILLLVWLMGSDNRAVVVGSSLVIGGALSNVVDRLIHPGVVDFLDFHVGGLHWPAFNLADTAIVVGCAMLAYDGLFGGRSIVK